MKNPPLGLHEGVVEKFYTRDLATGAVIDDPTLKAMAGGLAAARIGAEQIAASRAAIMADATRTVAARQIAAKAVTARLAAQAATALDAPRAKALAELQRLDAATVPHPPDPATAAEIRARLAALPERMRGEILWASIRDGSDTTVAAVLAGAPWLSGLSKAEHDLRLGQWQSRKFPVETERRDRLAKALRNLDDGGGALLDWLSKLNDAESVAAEKGAEAAANAIKAASLAAE